MTAEHDPVFYLGVDLRAPTRPVRIVTRDQLEPDVRLAFDELDDAMEQAEAPVMDTPWPDRRIWPCTRRLFAMWRFEAQGQHQNAENTRRSLTERGVLP